MTRLQNHIYEPALSVVAVAVRRQDDQAAADRERPPFDGECGVAQGRTVDRIAAGGVAEDFGLWGGDSEKSGDIWIVMEAAPLKGSSLDLPGITPEHLGDADQREDRAVNRPMIVADHEANAESQVEALEYPDGAH